MSSRGCNLVDWLWSIALYTAVIFALVGAVGVVHPLRRVHRGRRRHALVMMLIGLAAAYAISRNMPRTHAAVEREASVRAEHAA